MENHDVLQCKGAVASHYPLFFLVCRKKKLRFSAFSFKLTLALPVTWTWGTVATVTGLFTNLDMEIELDLGVFEQTIVKESFVWWRPVLILKLKVGQFYFLGCTEGRGMEPLCQNHSRLLLHIVGKSFLYTCTGLLWWFKKYYCNLKIIYIRTF